MKKRKSLCKKLYVPEECCELSFTKKKGANNYKHSTHEFETVRNEQMIMKIDRVGK